MLAKILAHKRTEIAGLDEAALRRAALDAPQPRPFLPPGPREKVGLIAEIKRASPSRGLLAPHLNLEEIARLYADNGAAAISVLTDSEFFLGKLPCVRRSDAPAGNCCTPGWHRWSARLPSRARP